MLTRLQQLERQIRRLESLPNISFADAGKGWLTTGEAARVLSRYLADITKWEKHYSILTEVIAQRLSPEDAPEWSSFVDRGVDFRGLQRLYRAADAVVFGLFEAIFGEEWVRFQLGAKGDPWPWFPVALFTGQSFYQIDLDAFVASIPASDLYRTRLWPTLAHEIGHAKVHALLNLETGALCALNALTQTGGGPAAKVKERRDRLRRLLSKRSLQRAESIARSYWDLVRIVLEIHQEILQGDKTEFAGSHTSEFLADSIAIHVMGPAALLSFLSITVLDTLLAENPVARGEDRRARRWSARTEHPPEYVRIALMERQLQKQLGGKGLPVDDLAVYRDRYKANLGHEQRKCLEPWVSRVDRLADLLSSLTGSILPGEPFGAADLEQCNQALEGVLFRAPKMCQPRYALNIAWLKRRLSHRLACAQPRVSATVGGTEQCSTGSIPGLFGALVPFPVDGFRACGSGA